MHLLGIIRSHCTLFLVLFVAHFTARSHGQAALDFMDMESTTLSPPQETSAPCKGDRDCAVQTQGFDTNTQFTDYSDSGEQLQQSTISSKTTANFCGPPPRLEYGVPEEKYLEKTTFPKGTEIKYVCRLGYVRIPSSSSAVTCMDDGTWSSPRTFCKPRSCGNPGDVNNAEMLAESFDFGSRVTYVCNVGYKMVSRRNYRDCQEDGKWSNDLPICIAVSCPSPLDIANGHYYPQKEEYTYLDSVKYGCSRNLALIGEQTISCTEEGKWSSNAPECKAVLCRNPNVLNAIKQSGFRGPYGLNSVVRFGCRQQHKLIGSDTVTCNHNSEWEPELPKCLGICWSVPSIPFAELVEPTTDKTFLEGTTLKFRCIQGYEPVSVAVNEATCSRLQWSNSDTFCKPITCVKPEPVPYGKIISGSFSFGDRIMYACETGYMIKHKYRKCLSDRTWSLPIPECEVQTCPAPAYVNNGWFDPEKEKYLYNDTITYDCYEGFQLVGQASITCRHDGRWNYQTPECRGICNAPSNFDNAQLQYHHTKIQTFFTGTTVQYTCKPGHYRDYRYIDTVTCLGNFTWSKLPYGFCQIFKCPTPAFVNNGWYDPEMQEYLYNDTITFDCHEGFQLVGQGLLTCREGRWDYNPPECRGVCDNPPDLPYAQLDFRFKDQTIFFAGSTVQYTCRPGYIQNYNYRYSNSISCLGNFTWSKTYNAFCNRTSCGRPPKIANASFEAKDFLFESEAIYKCEKGFKMVSQHKSVKCGANGRWSGTLPICEVQNCLPPEDLKDGSYTIKKNEYTYNESVTYKCDTLQLVGVATATCSDEGKWSSEAPQCKAVCIFPPELDFAVVEEEFIHQEFFDSGKTVQYKCGPGFVPVTGKSNTLTCLNTLKWSQHELFCTRISCGNPGAIDYGQMQSENFLFGSRVNYTCNPGYSMITRRNYRECQADGTWSGKPPVCKEPVCESIWELQEEARKCTSTPDEWIKYLQVQYLYLQIENLKLDIEIKKRQLDSPIQTSSMLHK